jgi:hypothetical protein
VSRNVAFQILRGVFTNIPALRDGEFYFATDQTQLYVGLSGSNLLIAGTMPVQVADRTTKTQLMAVETDGSILVNTGVTKTNVMKTFALGTATVGTNQTIISYTVTSGKTFYLEYIDVVGHLNNPGGGASILGTINLSIGGVLVYQNVMVNPTTSDYGSQRVSLTFSEPIPIASGTNIILYSNPAVNNPITWIGNMLGFER